MTDKAKYKICLLRLDGESIRGAADVIGVTPQTISNFLRKLPSKPDYKGYPKLPRETMQNICADYICKFSIEEIAKKNDLTVDEVKQVFYYITTRKPIAIDGAAYPQLVNWMQKNLYSIRDLEIELGISKSSLRRILNRKVHLKYELALKIRELTGISLTELFDGVDVGEEA